MREYTLTRSKRKSIAIYIRDGVLSVRAPLKADIKTIEKFVQSKEQWIERKMRESLTRQKQYADVLSWQAFLYLGNRLQVQKSDRKTIAIDQTTLFVPSAYFHSNILCASDDFQHKLKLLYKRIAKQYLGARLQALSQYLDVSYTQFSLTNALTKWGSCDSRNRIRLNWHLILLPESLIDYVIVHELMHTVEHNHSHRFWECVCKAYPAYKEAIRCLKDEGILIRL